MDERLDMTLQSMPAAQEANHTLGRITTGHSSWNTTSTSAQEGHGPAGTSPEDAMKMLSAGALRQAEMAEVVHSGEEKAMGRFHWIKGLQETGKGLGTRACSDRTRERFLNKQKASLDQILGRD